MLQNPLHRLAIVRPIGCDGVLRRRFPGLPSAPPCLRPARRLLSCASPAPLRASLPLTPPRLRSCARLVARPLSTCIPAGLPRVGFARGAPRLFAPLLPTARLLAGVHAPLPAAAVLLIARAVLRTGPLLRARLVAGPSPLTVLRLVAVGTAFPIALLRLALLAVSLVRGLFRLGSRAGIVGSPCALLRLAPLAARRLGIPGIRLAALAAIRAPASLTVVGPRLTCAAIRLRIVPLLAAATSFRILARAVAILPLPIAPLVASLAGRITLRLPNGRCAGVDPQRLPFGVRHVGRLRSIVHRERPVFDDPARTRAELLEVDPADAAERSLVIAPEDDRLGRGRVPLHAGLDADPGQAEVGIRRPHTNRHRCTGRHLQHRLLGSLDRHLGSEVGLHVDAMLHLFRNHLLPMGRSRAAGLKQQPVARMLGSVAVAVESEHESSGRPRQVAGADPHADVPLALAIEIDPGRLQRLVALCFQRDLRALDAPQIALPGHRLVGEPRVVGIVVGHLADEQRRLVDHGHPQPLAAGVAGGDHELERPVDPAGVAGQHGHMVAVRAAPRQFRLP